MWGTRALGQSGIQISSDYTAEHTPEDVHMGKGKSNGREEVQLHIMKKKSEKVRGRGFSRSV